MLASLIKRLVPVVLVLTIQPMALALPPAAPLITVETQTDAEYWLDSTYAMTGSAVGNVAILLTVLALDLVPDALAKTGETPPDLVNGNIWLGLLMVLPVLTTAFSLHWLAPKSEQIETDLGQTLLGSAIGTLVHLVVLIPLVLLLPHGSTTQQTVYDLAPVGILTGVLIEGLFAAQFYGKSKHWRVESNQMGLVLVHRIPF